MMLQKPNNFFYANKDHLVLWSSFNKYGFAIVFIFHFIRSYSSIFKKIYIDITGYLLSGKYPINYLSRMSLKL